MPRAPSINSWITVIAVMALIALTSGQAIAAEPISEAAFNRCRAIAAEAARLRCFENLTSPGPQIGISPPQFAPLAPPESSPSSTFQSVPSSSPIAGKWRLVHTPSPHDGQDVVSIMATAEFSGSDPDFAGLIVRCATPEFEILVSVISPYPLRARPTISIDGKKFQGSIVPPGVLIRLPDEANALAKEQWRTLASLPLTVENDGTITHGLVSLEGFDAALQTLTTSCLAR
jgi:hypothetical protein